MTRRTLITTAATTFALVLGLSVWATSTPSDDMMHSTSRAYIHSYNVGASGVALEGYCPVAYFAVNKPVRGSAEFASDHNGVTYHLVNADAKAAFDADPEKYLPAFGGWCAFGMSVEDKFPIDPTAFKIVDGRLFVFLRNADVDALDLWNQGSESELVKKAEAHWNTVAK